MPKGLSYWNDKVFEFYISNPDANKTIFLYIDGEILADLGEFQSKDEAIEDFVKSFAGPKKRQNLNRIYEHAIKWANSPDFHLLKAPPFISTLAISVLAVVEKKIHGHSSVYRLLNAYLRGETVTRQNDSIEMPEGYELVNELFVLWDKWLKKSGRKLGKPLKWQNALFERNYTNQLASRVHGFIKYSDKVLFDEYFRERDFVPGTILPIDELYGNFRYWLVADGRDSAVRIASAIKNDESAEEIVRVLLQNEFETWEGISRHGKEKMSYRGIFTLTREGKLGGIVPIKNLSDDSISFIENISDFVVSDYQYYEIEDFGYLANLKPKNLNLVNNHALDVPVSFSNKPYLVFRENELDFPDYCEVTFIYPREKHWILTAKENTNLIEKMIATSNARYESRIELGNFVFYRCLIIDEVSETYEGEQYFRIVRRTHTETSFSGGLEIDKDFYLIPYAPTVKIADFSSLIRVNDDEVDPITGEVDLRNMLKEGSNLLETDSGNRKVLYYVYESFPHKLAEVFGFRIFRSKIYPSRVFFEPYSGFFQFDNDNLHSTLYKVQYENNTANMKELQNNLENLKNSLSIFPPDNYRFFVLTINTNFQFEIFRNLTLTEKYTGILGSHLEYLQVLEKFKQDIFIVLKARNANTIHIQRFTYSQNGQANKSFKSHMYYYKQTNALAKMLNTNRVSWQNSNENDKMLFNRLLERSAQVEGSKPSEVEDDLYAQFLALSSETFPNSTLDQLMVWMSEQKESSVSLQQIDNALEYLGFDHRFGSRSDVIRLLQICFFLEYDQKYNKLNVLPPSLIVSSKVPGYAILLGSRRRKLIDRLVNMEETESDEWRYLRSKTNIYVRNGKSIGNTLKESINLSRSNQIEIENVSPISQLFIQFRTNELSFLNDFVKELNLNLSVGFENYVFSKIPVIDTALLENETIFVSPGGKKSILLAIKNDPMSKPWECLIWESVEDDNQIGLYKYERGTKRRYYLHLGESCYIRVPYDWIPYVHFGALKQSLYSVTRLQEMTLYYDRRRGVLSMNKGLRLPLWLEKYIFLKVHSLPYIHGNLVVYPAVDGALLVSIQEKLGRYLFNDMGGQIRIINTNLEDIVTQEAL